MRAVAKTLGLLFLAALAGCGDDEAWVPCPPAAAPDAYGAARTAFLRRHEGDLPVVRDFEYVSFDNKGCPACYDMFFFGDGAARIFRYGTPAETRHEAEGWVAEILEERIEEVTDPGTMPEGRSYIYAFIPRRTPWLRVLETMTRWSARSRIYFALKPRKAGSIDYEDFYTVDYSNELFGEGSFGAAQSWPVFLDTGDPERPLALRAEEGRARPLTFAEVKELLEEKDADHRKHEQIRVQLRHGATIEDALNLHNVVVRAGARRACFVQNSAGFDRIHSERLAWLGRLLQRSRSEYDARDAARWLSREGEEGRRILSPCLDAPLDEARLVLVLDGLARLGPIASPSLPAIERFLQSPSQEVREAALKAKAAAASKPR
jgi:hypothetical protein